MSLTVCWSAKGGSGTTVVAAALALGAESESLLVDLDGELPLALGVTEPAGQGLSDWFDSDVPATGVTDLAVKLRDGARLIPRGARRVDPDAARWAELRDFLAASSVDVVVDAGHEQPPTELLLPRHRRGEPKELRVVDPAAGTVRSLLVTRACYLSVERARILSRPDGIVFVDEPGRRLGAAEVSRAIGAPIVVRVPIDPAIFRAVDQGLLASKFPKGILKSLRIAA